MTFYFQRSIFLCSKFTELFVCFVSVIVLSCSTNIERGRVRSEPLTITTEEKSCPQNKRANWERNPRKFWPFHFGHSLSCNYFHSKILHPGLQPENGFTYSPIIYCRGWLNYWEGWDFHFLYSGGGGIVERGWKIWGKLWPQQVPQTIDTYQTRLFPLSFAFSTMSKNCWTEDSQVSSFDPWWKRNLFGSIIL